MWVPAGSLKQRVLNPHSFPCALRTRGTGLDDITFRSSFITAIGTYHTCGGPHRLRRWWLTIRKIALADCCSLQRMHSCERVLLKCLSCPLFTLRCYTGNRKEVHSSYPVGSLGASVCHLHRFWQQPACFVSVVLLRRASFGELYSGFSTDKWRSLIAFSARHQPTAAGSKSPNKKGRNLK